MFSTILANYVEAFRGLPRSVWLLSIVLLINRAGTMVLPFFILYLRGEQDFSAMAAGQMLALFGLGAVAGNFLSGLLTDRIGVIRIQVLGLVLSGAGFLLLYHARGVLQIGSALFLTNLLAEVVRPASGAATARLTPPALRPRAFALNRLAVNVGWSIGPALGGFLAEFGYGWLFYIDVATCILAGLFLWSAFRGLVPQPPEPVTRDGSSSTNAETASNAMSTKSPSSTTTTETASTATGLSPWRDTEFMTSILLQFLIALVFFQMHGTFVLYLDEQLGFSKRRIGALMAINTIVIVAVEMVLVRSIEKIPPLRLLAWGTLMTGIGFGLLPWGSGTLYCAATILVWTLGEMVSASPSMAYTSSRATDQSQGSYMAVYSMCFSAASIVAPILGTGLYARSPALVWHMCSLIGVFCWIGFLVLQRWSRSWPVEAGP